MWDRHVSPTGSIETLQLTSAGAFNLPPREKYPLLCRRLHGAVVSLPSKMTSTWGKSADVDMFFLFIFFFFQDSYHGTIHDFAKVGSEIHFICLLGWCPCNEICGTSIGLIVRLQLQLHCSATLIGMHPASMDLMLISLSCHWADCRKIMKHHENQKKAVLW